MALFLRGFAFARKSGGLRDFWRGGILDPEAKGEAVKTGRVSGDAWPACLLRLKSFSDLHCLWYILLKEKNFLLTERQYAATHKVPWIGHGRLKKVKLSMKRILTVISRREIHKQVLRSKEIRDKMEIREELEHRRFHLEEQMKVLEHKIEKSKKRMQESWRVNIDDVNLGSENHSIRIEEDEESDTVYEQDAKKYNLEPLILRGWTNSLEKYKKSLEDVMIELRPLRKDTMVCMTPDWRHSTTYSDIPGNWSWKKQWIRAIENSKKKFARYH